jgi:hypothetical protein
MVKKVRKTPKKTRRKRRKNRTRKIRGGNLNDIKVGSIIGSRYNDNWTHTLGRVPFLWRVVEIEKKPMHLNDGIAFVRLRPVNDKGTATGPKTDIIAFWRLQRMFDIVPETKFDMQSRTASGGRRKKETRKKRGIKKSTIRSGGGTKRKLAQLSPSIIDAEREIIEERRRRQRQQQQINNILHHAQFRILSYASFRNAPREIRQEPETGRGLLDRNIYIREISPTFIKNWVTLMRGLNNEEYTDNGILTNSEILHDWKFGFVGIHNKIYNMTKEDNESQKRKGKYLLKIVFANILLPMIAFMHGNMNGVPHYMKLQIYIVVLHLFERKITFELPYGRYYNKIIQSIIQDKNTTAKHPHNVIYHIFHNLPSSRRRDSSGSSGSSGSSSTY